MANVAIEGLATKVDALAASTSNEFEVVAQEISKTHTFTMDGLGALRRTVTAGFTRVDERFEGLGKRIDARFDKVDKRFDGVDSRLERIESKLDRLIANRPPRVRGKRRG